MTVTDNANVIRASLEKTAARNNAQVTAVITAHVTLLSENASASMVSKEILVKPRNALVIVMEMEAVKTASVSVV